MAKLIIGHAEDIYRVVPHRDVLDCSMYSAITGERLNDDFEHTRCGMPLSWDDIADANWCPHCASTINKAAAKRARSEWK